MAEKCDFSKMFLNAEIKPIPNLQAELLPCPFCGGEAFIEVIPPHKHYIATFMADYDGGAFAECTKCSCAISADNEQDAINKWNTRKPQERGGEK